ncbi:pyridoxal phosphate-dependent aminotransferase [Ekhidna sp.]
MVDTLKSKRLSGIGEYYFSRKLRDIEVLNSQGENVLNLGIGSPDLPPPHTVRETLVKGFDESNYHQYQSYKGIPDLRSAFAKWYSSYFDVSLDPDHEVLPLIGSKEGIIHISMSLLDEGDQALIPNPGYPAYSSATTLAGGEAIHYSLNEANNYHPDFKELEAMDLSKVKLMWVNYPHMPTGSDGTDELFERLIAFSRKHQIVVINDNPYGFILTEKQRSLLQQRDNNDLILELNSLSKSHNMAGWRVGVLAGNADLIQVVLSFKSNVDSGQFKPVMRSAIAALEVGNEWYGELNDEYRIRKKLAKEVVDLIGCSSRSEEVGMFIWAKIPETFSDGETYADYLLEKYRIFIPPGSVFGSEGKSFVRLSLCSSQEMWQEVIKRIKKKQA